MIKISFLKYLFLTAFIFFSSCGVNNQAKQIKALEKCTYKVVSIKELQVAGTDVKRIFERKELQLNDLPGVAIGLLSKNIPLKTIVDLEVTNPGSNTAAVNEFEYIILLENQELANGLVNTPFEVAPGQKAVVPVQINSNIYGLVSNKALLDKVLETIKTNESNKELGELTIKLKPTFRLGKGSFKYPGYINIKKKITLDTFK